MGMVREDILTAYFGSNWSYVTIRKLTHQPKKVVNQNGDIKEWKRRGIFLLIYTTPVLPMDTTKINYS